MKALTSSVLRRLADGEFHSGEALAKSLDFSRASVWNAIRDLEAAGIEVYKVHGRGYRLPYPIPLLDRSAVERRLGANETRFPLGLLHARASTHTQIHQQSCAT